MILENMESKWGGVVFMEDGSIHAMPFVVRKVLKITLFM